MPTSTLDGFVRIGLLRPEPSTQAEFDGLVRSGRVRLADAANHTLSPASRFDLACHAARALELAALRWHGYRALSSFQCAAHTLGLESAQWQVLDEARRNYALVQSKGDLGLDAALVDRLVRTAQVMAERVSALGPVPPPMQ